MLRSIPLMEAVDSFDFEVTRRKPMTNRMGSASPRRTFAGYNHGRYVQFNALVFAGLQSSNRFTTEMSSVNVETFIPTRTLRRMSTRHFCVYISLRNLVSKYVAKLLKYFYPQISSANVYFFDIIL